MQPNNEADTASTIQVEPNTISTGQLQTDTEIQQLQQQNSEPQSYDKFISMPKSDLNNLSQPNDQQAFQIGTDENQSILQPIIPIPNPQSKINKKQAKPKQQTNSLNQQQGQQMPVFWDLLNNADKEAYNKMRIALSSPACKHRRHHSNELNREIVNTIKSFVVRNDADDWKRALVTGIVWLPNAIAINTRQLRLLLSKCKSSINALFQKLGYYTIPTTNDYSSSIISCFPLLKDNFPELRKWTIRLISPPDAKSALNQQQQQQMAFQQPQQNTQPIQIIQIPQTKNEENKNESVSLVNGNENTVVPQQQLQVQSSEPNTSLIVTPHIEFQQQ